MSAQGRRSKGRSNVKHGRTLKALLEREIQVKGAISRVFNFDEWFCAVCMHVVQFLRIFFVFLEFSRNRLVVMCDSPGHACSRPSLLGLLLRIAWRWRATAKRCTWCSIHEKCCFSYFSRSKYRWALVLYYQGPSSWLLGARRHRFSGLCSFRKTAFSVR